MKLIVITVLLGMVLAALSGIFWAGDRHGSNRVLLEQSKIMAEADQAWRKEIEEKTQKTDQLQVELIAEKNNIKTRIKTVEKQVVKYVKDDISCNYTRGAISLLNQAWHSTGKALPENTVLSEAEAAEASTIGQQALIGKQLEYAEWCISLEAQFDSLVDATDKLGY